MPDGREDELRALISHWYQSPDVSLPYLTDSITSELKKIICETTGNESGTLVEEAAAYYQGRFDFPQNDVPFPPVSSPRFTFIDLFAGIGGFRLAFQKHGGKCVFSSEWDKYAKKTYEANFGEIPYGDITKIDKTSIPGHDVLCAGFPCQPFSLAGISKKNSLGRKHGFEDKTQGTLFFEIKEILKLKRPRAFMLENVKNLLSHDKGKTFEVIRETLEDELGYVINWKIVDGGKWVPQHRERIFIIGFDPSQIPVSKDQIAIPDHPLDGHKAVELNQIIQENVSDHTIGPGTWDTLKRHKQYHADRGNGFGYGLHSLPIADGVVTRTISARYHKDGAEILVEQKNDRPRRLTVSEAMQLQGYDPARFIFPVSNTQSYKQIGNSVVVPAISDSARLVSDIIIKSKNGFVGRV